MNLLLLDPEQSLADGRFQITGARAKHVQKVLRKKIGDTIRVGLLGGKCGYARIVESSADGLSLGDLELSMPPPVPSRVRLILALPRPKVAGRLLENITELGVKDVVLVNSSKVESSYWSAHQLKTENIKQHLLAGLEISRDTILPQVSLKRSFRAFIEDDLPGWAGNHLKILAHPNGEDLQHHPATTGLCLAVGPEGGWSDFEVDLFKEHGFQTVRFGSRVLSCETAVPALLYALS